MSNLTQWVLCGVNVCKSGHCQSNLWQKHAEPHHREPWPLTQNGFCWWRLDEERVRGLDLTNWVLMVMKNDIPKSNNLVTNLSKGQSGHDNFSWFLVKSRAYFYLGQVWSSAAAGEETTCPRTCWSGKSLWAGRHWHWVRLENWRYCVEGP